MILPDGADLNRITARDIVTEYPVRMQKYNVSVGISRIANRMWSTTEEAARGVLLHQWAELLEVDSKVLTLDLVVEYPADWWQAVKDRWFPKQALSRWPVRLAKVERRGQIRAASILPDLKVIPGRDVVYVATKEEL